MTITNPQPEYVDRTAEAVDEALEPAVEPGTEQFKLVPTSVDWLEARTDGFLIICPLCAAPVYKVEVDQHTAWHQKLLDIVLLLAG